MKSAHEKFREQDSAQRRAHNRENSARILKERDYSFETKNDGAHLIVTSNGNVWDFWPGTGKWKDRSKPGYGRGVFNLINAIEDHLRISVEGK